MKAPIKHKMMATEECTSANNLETSQFSHRGHNNDENRHLPEDFVSPPRCWFEDSISSSSNNGSNPTTAELTSITVNRSTEQEENFNESRECRRTSFEQKKRQFQQEISSQVLPATARVTGFDVVVGNTGPSPSWREISSQVLPAAARELMSTSIRRLYYTAKISYSHTRWHRKYSDMGCNAGAFSISASSNLELPMHILQLPPFSSLPWIDRQLVQEWRTYLPETPTDAVESEDFEFERARILIPNLIPRPTWKKSDVCYSCHRPFGPIRLRHHCRSCGQSFCQDHSMSIQPLPHLGYNDDVPERVCDSCQKILDQQNLAERVAWRLARCRDYKQDCLTPYFCTGIDSAEELALRVTKAAIAMAKSIPLGAQATVAVETVNVLRKYGLHGIYGIMLRKEFLAAADLLRQALGINNKSWPLSVHELSAAIFYALAQHRAMRGLDPEREHAIHSFRSDANSHIEKFIKETPSPSPSTPINRTNNCNFSDPTVMVDSYELFALDFHSNSVNNKPRGYNPAGRTMNPEDPRKLASCEEKDKKKVFWEPCIPVCESVPDSVLTSLIFYSPIALNFIYATKEVEIQLLAAQQGWRLIYAFLNQDTTAFKPCDRPASALFLHQEYKIACLSIRGTASINDVITDIRQIPVPFPETELEPSENNDGDWTNVYRGQGLALCGMASAAANLFHEHIDALLHFVKQGYRIRLVGHSLGGGVATMLGVLVLRHFEHVGYSNSPPGKRMLLKVYSYGAPSCFDAKLADSVNSFVTTVVLHDDVFPRLTPTSCRRLLKHILHIKETWVEMHIREDLRAVGERAKTAWAPRFRQNFTLQRSSTSSIKKYCKKKILKGKSKLLSVKSDDERGISEKAVAYSNESSAMESFATDSAEWGEKLFVPTTKVSMTNTYLETPEEIYGSATNCTKETSGEDTKMNKKASDDADVSVTNKYKETGEAMDQPNDSLSQSILEFIGGGDNEIEGLIIDGETFFEADESLVESCDDGSESKRIECFSDPIHKVPDEQSLPTNDSWSFNVHDSDSLPSKNKGYVDDPVAVVLEESPLPNMLLPGKVIHIYSHRGVYRAAYVPRTFKELRRISLAGNMLSNHTTKSYFEGLLEVQTVRAAQESPPRWTSYDEDNTCCCCANRFTWASTSDSEAQEARDKHNCRSCGGLICDPCSRNRVPIPSIGCTVPVRVCDRCYNNMMGGVSAAPVSVQHEEGKHKPERWRKKRSIVVDDLVSQMRSSALT